MLNKHSTTKLCPNLLFFFFMYGMCVNIYVLMCVCVPIEVHDWWWEHPSWLSTFLIGSTVSQLNSQLTIPVSLASRLATGIQAPPSEADIQSRLQYPPGICMSYGHASLPSLLLLFLIDVFSSPSPWFGILIGPTISFWKFCRTSGYNHRWNEFQCFIV